MNLPIKLIASVTLSLLTLLANLSHANDTDNDNKAAAKPVQKWYKVEVIIFTQRDVFGDELPSRDIVMSYPEKVIDLDNNLAGFVTLPDGERELGPDVYSLNRTGVYNVLFHKAWQQPGLAPTAAPWINIDIAGENTAINGSLRVYLSSYLHMESNIWQVSYATALEPTSPQLLGNTVLMAENPLQTPPGTDLLLAAPTPWPQPPTSPITLTTVTTEEKSTSEMLNPISVDAVELSPINVNTAELNAVQRSIEEIILLKQASRLKLNKLHYFDHPKMGLLFKVTRSEEPIIQNLPKPETDESTPTEQTNTDTPVFGTNPALY